MADPAPAAPPAAAEATTTAAATDATVDAQPTMAAPAEQTAPTPQASSTAAQAADNAASLADAATAVPAADTTAATAADLADSPAGDDDAAPAEAEAPTKPKGRRNRFVKVTDDGRVEEGASMGLWPAIVGTIATIIVIIDDEWIWIPGLAYGVAFWAYKRVRNGVMELLSVDPKVIACAAGASALSTAASPGLTALTEKALGSAAKGMTTLSRSMFLSPGGVISPLTWGFRMSGFVRIAEQQIQSTDAYDVTWTHKASTYFLAGAGAEFFSRLFTAPLVKIVDQCRKQPGMSAARVTSQLLREKGSLALWEGMAPLRVECPHVGVMLMTWGLTRERIGRMYTTRWEDADPLTRAISRFPADLASGALATVAAYTATHSWRLAYEESRQTETMFTKHGAKQACPLVVNHARVPLKECLALRVPHTSFIFAAFGAAMSFLAPEHNELGVAGWGEHDVVVETTYGGMVRDTRRVDDSFWAFFGVRFGEVQNYDRYKRRREQEKNTE